MPSRVPLAVANAAAAVHGARGGDATGPDAARGGPRSSRRSARAWTCCRWRSSPPPIEWVLPLSSCSRPGAAVGAAQRGPRDLPASAFAAGDAGVVLGFSLARRANARGACASSRAAPRWRRSTPSDHDGVTTEPLLASIMEKTPLVVVEAGLMRIRGSMLDRCASSPPSRSRRQRDDPARAPARRVLPRVRQARGGEARRGPARRPEPARARARQPVRRLERLLRMESGRGRVADRLAFALALPWMRTRMSCAMSRGRRRCPARTTRAAPPRCTGTGSSPSRGRVRGRRTPSSGAAARARARGAAARGRRADCTGPPRGADRRSGRAQLCEAAVASPGASALAGPLADASLGAGARERDQVWERAAVIPDEAPPLPPRRRPMARRPRSVSRATTTWSTAGWSGPSSVSARRSSCAASSATIAGSSSR